MGMIFSGAQSSKARALQKTNSYTSMWAGIPAREQEQKKQ